MVLLVMVQTFTSWLIVAEYAINKDYIAKNLCINRKKPRLRCNGKCQLMKKLAEEEKQNSSSNSQTGGKLKFDVLFTCQMQLPAIDRLPEDGNRFNPFFILKKSEGTDRSVFHPPAAA